jgi:Tfp pilus assembly protein PilV
MSIEVHQRRQRRGSLLVEVAMAVVMLVIAMTLTVKVLGWVAMERRASDRRQWAAQEVCNVMERVTARPFDTVSQGSVGDITLSAQARQMLPGGELKIEVVEDDPTGGKGSKRVSVQLRWHDRSGGWDAPARLTSWIYRGRPGS